MKLFNEFEAVKFPEENRILITHHGYLYYVYEVKHGYWHKHRNAGYDSITVENYPDVTREELMEALGGRFPEKLTDFTRQCYPAMLNISELMDLLEEDYPHFMEDREIRLAVHRFMFQASILHKAYQELRELFDEALAGPKDSAQVFREIKELSFSFTGRDLFKNEIGIIDGHDRSSYFWIMPVRVIDYTDTNNTDNVSEMRSAEISIEEDDVAQYLMPFLSKYYDDSLEANRKRVDDWWTDDDGQEHITYTHGFEWNLTHNFFTYESVRNMLVDMVYTADALSAGRENEFTAELREKRGFGSYTLVYAKDLTDEQIAAYNANRPKEDDTPAELIIDFYRRFVYRMEYMLTVGRENGYDLISFMGP